MKRAGWTLHEMLISLSVMSGVMALAAHAAVGQLQFFRGLGEVVGLRGQLAQASAIAANQFWALSPEDFVVADDSAVDIHASIGTAVACASTPGQVTIPVPSSQGNTLASFSESPEPGDRVHALFTDSLGATWLTLHVASTPVTAGRCPAFSSVAATSTFALRELITVPVGAPLRFTRRLRMSLYRASDSRWYLGAKDWNASLDTFNTIQPVAGPLLPYNSHPEHTGLLFQYRDGAGRVLTPSPLVPTASVVNVTVVSRAASTRPVRIPGMSSGPSVKYLDSVAVVVSLRNAQ